MTKVEMIILLALVSLTATATAVGDLIGMEPSSDDDLLLVRPGGCAIGVLEWGSCLPYIAAESWSSTPSADCCSAFSLDPQSCVCYLYRHPSILDIPISLLRLASLSSVCGLHPTTTCSVSDDTRLPSPPPPSPPILVSPVSDDTSLPSPPPPFPPSSFPVFWISALVIIITFLVVWSLFV